MALARALAREPELLLLDEPTSALDPATRDAVMGELIEEIRRIGLPTLAVTHDVHLAAMADRMALMLRRRIVQEGTPRMVFGQPVNAGAARLLGYRNVFEGTVVELAHGQATVALEGVRLRTAAPDWAKDESRVGIAIRSEDIALAPEDPTPAGSNLLALTVASLREEGLALRLATHGSIALDILLARATRADNLAAGAPIRVAIRAEHVHLFRVDT